ncbi:WD40-repeat-containing domain protein [Suillus cothurnatus]|nr:WD40-repeat-containing domain protein [Suillus cothurnatus]
MTAYIHIRTLSEGHSDSINSLAFSRCGRYLASGSDDKCVIIWRLDDGSILYRLLLDSSVTVVFWHPTLRDTVIIGCEDGNLCQLRHLRIDDFSRKDFDLGADGPVHCLEYDTDTGCFALGIGHHVYVAHESRESSGLGVSFKVPQPSEELTGDNPKPVRARGLHFHKKGTTSMLIVSYLHHGVIAWDVQRMTCLWRIWPRDAPLIGSSAVSPEIKALIVQTMHKGLFMYLIGGSRPSRGFIVPGRPNEKCRPLQVRFLEGGSKVICGSNTGEVRMWDTSSGEVFQNLPHGGMFHMKIPLCFQGHNSYIAAASSQKGQNSYIQIWRAKTGGRFFVRVFLQLLSEMTRQVPVHQKTRTR